MENKMLKTIGSTKGFKTIELALAPAVTSIVGGGEFMDELSTYFGKDNDNYKRNVKIKHKEDNTMSRTIRNAKGFTLVELAIVLVIIGIILGAVLKGQELINNAQAKRAYNQVREVTAAVYTYMDRYGGRLPGDDPTATAALRGAGWATGTGGTLGNGLFEGNTTTTMFTCATAATTEACIAWDHLKRSNIISGTLDSSNPSNSYGGTIGIANAAVSGLTTNWIGLSNIPSNVAQQLDIQYDDGIATTGSIRALAAYTAGSQARISIFFRL
ncbi:MAG TPA: prepilin-type N-terminal cleavage/methylation domain-containing protein [Syntrophorhabdaceae bacterium]|nr:prepilin-type N-terminal cleavage/methylation domain-containing protein [Syntrophorhabdaceae bacterium]